jgi:hypothetical protein
VVQPHTPHSNSWHMLLTTLLKPHVSCFMKTQSLCHVQAPTCASILISCSPSSVDQTCRKQGSV